MSEVPAVCRGLVPVSTSQTGLSFPAGKPVLQFLADDTFQIDPQRARVVRLRKGIGVSAKWLHNAAGHCQKCMVTLTYAGSNADWSAKHIAKYIDTVRKWYSRECSDKLRYVWVAELQERGVIHYHAVFWLRAGVTMPKADKRGWWPHGMTRTEDAVKPIGYLMSYLSKIETKNVFQFPHGARLFGIGGLCKTGRDIKRWIHWPSYVQGNAASGDSWKPAPGGGFIDSSTGEHLRSEFVPVGNSHRCFRRVHTHTRAVDASGPFSWFQSGAATLGKFQ